MKYKRPKLYKMYPFESSSALCANGEQANSNSCLAGPEAVGGCGSGTAASSRCSAGTAAGINCKSGTGF